MPDCWHRKWMLIINGKVGVIMKNDGNDNGHHDEIERLLNLVREEQTYRNYWMVSKKIKQLADDRDVESQDKKNTIKIAILSSFTVDPLLPCLDVECRLVGLDPHFYVSPFNRFQDVVLDPSSKLYSFDPDVVFFFVELESLVPETFRVDFPRMSEEMKNAGIDSVFSRIKGIIDFLTSRIDGLVVFSNFIVPKFSPLGILDNKNALGMKRFYHRLNERLEVEFRTSRQVYVFDLDSVAGYFGKSKCYNPAQWYRGSIPYDNEFFVTIAKEVMSYIKALKSRNRKCLVLDLDNTLWGGIIGEDGLEGIKLDKVYPGNQYYDFQKTILSLYNRGIILAVNSKNNPEDALEVFRDHPHMLIKEQHLAAYRINWQDKVQNLMELAKEINIGLDSMVFVDDNPVERARVKQSLPEVLVVDLPKTPALYRTALETLNDFDVLSLTEEDLKRGEMYYARRQRKVLESKVQNIEDFIKSLEITCEIKLADEFALPRVTSLLNRTNQFNLTTRRYNEVEVRNMFENSTQFRLYTLRVRDKFGDEGIVGVAIVKMLSDHQWYIDSFLMSCRVIGRKIETAFVIKIIKDARRAGVTDLESEYIPTRKNRLVSDFYDKHGFELIARNEDGAKKYRLNPQETQVEYPQYLTVLEDN